MSVEFQDEVSLPQVSNNQTKGLYALVVRWGLAKDTQSAKTVLVIALGILVSLMVLVLVFGRPPSTATPATKLDQAAQNQYLYANPQ